MKSPDVIPCKAIIEATGQNVNGVIRFASLVENGRFILDSRMKSRFTGSRVLYIPVFESKEPMKGIDMYTYVRTEKLDFEAYYAEENNGTYSLIGVRPLSQNEYDKIIGLKR